jgi:hypothetical protein
VLATGALRFSGADPGLEELVDEIARTLKGHRNLSEIERQKEAALDAEPSAAVPVLDAWYSTRGSPGCRRGTCSASPSDRRSGPTR